MIDTLLKHRHKFNPQAAFERFSVEGEYAVATLHRPANVDDPEEAAELVTALQKASDLIPVILPLHPRGRASLSAQGLTELENVTVIDPLGYIDFLSMVSGARAVITDSGGVQEETTMLGIPCLTMRPNTERPVTITTGTNRLVAPSQLAETLNGVLSSQFISPDQQPPLWDGNAGERISAVICDWIHRS
jgi:UDP-N-acetylglucosamine 2-epimerase